MSSWELEIYKSFIRNKLRHLLRQLTDRERRAKSRKVIARLAATPHFRKAKNIFAFLPLPYEVETGEFIRKALNLGKNIFLPEKAIDNGLKIYQIKRLPQNYKTDRWGTLESLSSRAKKGRPAALDLILVPGLGFDASGRRLGRGGGSFDRFLSEVKAPKIALAFREQILDKIPCGAHDVHVDAVITD